MEKNPLRDLEALGQSVWLDYIRRDLMTGGGLRRLIEEDGLRGVTSNPSLFEKAIGESHLYDKDIGTLGLNGNGGEAMYEALSLGDVRTAADELKPVYEKTNGQDGFVSLEVNPHLAHDTRGTLKEARRLWTSLDRPNVFIKIPATAEGLPAIQQLTGEGINVNITLLFGLARYRQAADAYIAGIEARLALGKDVSRVASVASFFVSRIDALVDPLLEKIADEGGSKAEFAGHAFGRVAVASAKTAYQMFKNTRSTDRFRKLAAKGARVQRLLWASTGAKNPAFSDVKYVEALIGPDTISTMPLETLDAYRDHGDPKPRLGLGVEEAGALLDRLPEVGIEMEDVARRLEDEGVEKFCRPFDALMKTLTQMEPARSARV